MECINESQDQPGNCPECGMKLLPTDELGFETDQFGLTTTDQFGFKTDKNGYKINKNPHKSVPDPYIFVDPHKSVSTSCPHKSVGTYLYFIEGHITIEAIEKLITEKPEIDGIALLHMPSGSPGMPGFKLEKWKIHSVKNGQDQGIFMEI
jgi:hypothetical protein